MDHQLQQTLLVVFSVLFSIGLFIKWRVYDRPRWLKRIGATDETLRQHRRGLKIGLAIMGGMALILGVFFVASKIH